MMGDSPDKEFRAALRMSIDLRSGMCIALVLFLIGLGVLPGASALGFCAALCVIVFVSNMLLLQLFKRDTVRPGIIVHAGYLLDVAGYTTAILGTGGLASPLPPLFTNVVMSAGLVGFGSAAFYATLCAAIGISMIWAPPSIVGPAVSPELHMGMLALDNIAILVHSAIAVALYRNRTIAERDKLQAVKDELQKALDEMTVYERQQRELNESLKTSMKARSEFLALMSHELRTPLNSVIGFADLMLESNVKTTEEERRVFLGHIQRGGRNLLSIIDNLIDLSRLNAGSLVMRTDDVNLERLASDAYETSLARAEEQALTLQCTIAPNLPRVHADPKRVRQILSELLNNALRFTPKGGRIDLVVARAEEGVWMRVTDTGCGIPKEHLERIFEPFHQVDSSTRRKHGGTGLGLAMVHTFAEAMGGRIEVTSELGEGTTMSFFLPLNPPSDIRETAE